VILKNEKSLRVDEAAEVLGCSSRQIYRLISEGQVRAFRVGKIRGLRVIESSLHDFVDRRLSAFELENGLFYDSSDSSD
jgi:excisionase family DNA binding protein